jgi:hypothetical protein
VLILVHHGKEIFEAANLSIGLIGMPLKIGAHPEYAPVPL